ncbi:2OG-Fe(II) oxygenase [Coleofasciculus chthonoplastes]|uniref:2OG-Fe(II) oxygenase n=1 Tax=Coleofasciculus chthonoplastes TaxID=64178 RepID=UPI0032F69077
MRHFLTRLRHRILREISQIKRLQIRGEQAYQKALQDYATHKPILSRCDLQIVNSLEREGIFVTSLDNLQIPLTCQLIHACQNLLPKILAASPSSPKDYLLKVPPEQLMEYPQLFHWGLEERLLNIVENYLALPVAYHGLYFRRDLANKIQRRTRLWHLDKEDYRMLKIILYLNDVGENGGCFQYIPKTLTHSILRRLNYNYGTIKDQVMEQVVPQEHWKSCPGSSGTLLFVDSAHIFHRGQVPIGSDRLSIFFDYTSRVPKYPYYCKTDFSIQQLMALSHGLCPRKKGCVFWNKKLLRDSQNCSD